jgi:hypothetical protein
MKKKAKTRIKSKKGRKAKTSLKKSLKLARCN